jgi:hypothetical protein
LSQFNTHYNIFRNLEFFREKKNSERNKESDGIFESTSFVEMEFSKLINYSTNMC